MHNPFGPVSGPRRWDAYLLAAILIGIALAVGSLELALTPGGLP